MFIYILLFIIILLSVYLFIYLILFIYLFFEGGGGGGGGGHTRWYGKDVLSHQRKHQRSALRVFCRGESTGERCISLPKRQYCGKRFHKVFLYGTYKWLWLDKYLLEISCWDAFHFCIWYTTKRIFFSYANQSNQALWKLLEKIQREMSWLFRASRKNVACLLEGPLLLTWFNFNPSK